MNLILRYLEGRKAVPVSSDPHLKAELEQTKKDLNSILEKWKFGEQPIQTSAEFLTKFEPWIDTQIQNQQDLKLFLAQKGVNNLNEAKTKLTNRDLSAGAELENFKNELETKHQQELAQVNEELSQLKNNQSDLQAFLTENSVNNLTELSQLWENTEQDYLKQIEDLKAETSDEGRIILETPEDYEELKEELANLREENQRLTEQLTSEPGDWETRTANLIQDQEQQIQELETKQDELTTERDELSRDKITLEQETFDLSNKLKNKNQEVKNKDQQIQTLKKEKSDSEIALNKKLTDQHKEYGELKKKYSKRTQELDEEQCENNKLEEKIATLEREIHQLKAGRPE